MNWLNLANFVDIKTLYHAPYFSDQPCTEWMSTSLDRWLDQLLTELGVGDKPIVKGKVAEGAYLSGRVFVAEGAIVEPTAMIVGPTYIGPGTEVRHGAYIRGRCYIGANAVVGHATEVKSSVFMDGAKAGHFAYVGDSILGREVNLGAGTKLANLKLRADAVKLKHPTTGELVVTGMKKFGAIMGDGAQTGCNAVLSPGTVLFPKTAVMSCVHFHGTLTKGIAR